jgi:putative FmdB family regulatory protein
MPIYEYKCTKCGTIFEFLCGLGDQKKIVCRNCGNRDVDRVMSAAAVLKSQHKQPGGHTCCGSEARCETPPCSTRSGCQRK